MSEDAKKKVKASRKIVDDVVKDGTGILIASLASAWVWSDALAHALVQLVSVGLTPTSYNNYRMWRYNLLLSACMQLSMVSTLDLELWERKTSHPISLSKPAYSDVQISVHVICVCTFFTTQ